MEVTGKILCNKIREIMPGISSSITPEILNKICEDRKVQPFVKWFCSNVKRENILCPDEIKLKKHIKKKGEWLEGEELDAALAEATKDCPELLKLLTADPTYATQLADEVEAEKDACKEDMDYLQTLEDSLRNLKELETRLDNEIETEETQLEKDQIQMNNLYTKCVNVLDEFDMTHRQFFRDIESLVKAYSVAVEKKGTPVVWSQVPLGLFIKQLEMHNDYLGVYVKRHFGDQVELVIDNSDCETLVDDGKLKSGDEKVRELFKCQSDVITMKTDEINAKVEEYIYSAMAEHAADIYNNMNSRTPQSETQLRVEIAMLTSKRDILEENIALIRDIQLKEVVRKYARLVITQILVNNGHSRSARRKKRLEKLENFRQFAREKGHGLSDLLCMLMQLQLQRLQEIVKFIADGRHYLATEYSLSAVRSGSMEEQQAKFDAIMNAAPSEQNVFNKIFTSLVLEAESRANNSDDLSAAIKRCDELIEDNEKRKKDLLGVQLDRRIDDLTPLQNEVMSLYDAETLEGPTNSFKPTPYKLTARLEESAKRVREMQESVSQIRARLKNLNKKTADNPFARDTAIMWQRFLANPGELQAKYDEAKNKIETAHFAENLNN